MKKDSQGITLIALVITIIVLLILAGISIATLTGENGVLTKANDAKEKSVEGEEKEQIKLAYNAAVTEKLEKEDSSNVTESELQGELDNLKAEATAQGTNPIKVTFSKTKHIYEVNNKGNVEVSPGSDINEGKYAFTINGITCYFDENDDLFELWYNEDENCWKAHCSIASWLEEHILGAEIDWIGGSAQPGFLLIDGQEVEFSGTIFMNTSIDEGNSFTMNIEDLESRIHYD